MEPQYYIYNSEQAEEYLENIWVFLNDNEVEKGSLFFKPANGSPVISIEYNRMTGEVIAASKENNIVNFFSFTNITKPVTDAISLIAKRNLLLQLEALKDGIIAPIISECHRDSNGAICNIHPAAIENTITKIQKRLKPTFFSGLFNSNNLTALQKAVRDILTPKRVEAIRSEKGVKDLMEEIEQRALTLAPKRKTPTVKK